MASILIVSMDGVGVPLALRMAEDGHIVKMWIKDPKAHGLLQGYRNPSKVNDPYKMIDQYDLVLSDMVGTGTVCDNLVKKGKLVLGGGSFNDKLEMDRAYGSKVAASLTKTKQPHTTEVGTRQELIAHLDAAKKPLVIKPLNNKSTSLTLVSHDAENKMLKSVISNASDDYTPCIVQETVKGIEISTEGWFNGEEWVSPFNHTIERKRLMEGDKGALTGCMGNVVWPTQSNKLTSFAIEPLKPLLEKVEYVGPIDMNCIVTETDAYFLEFTARFGYDAIQAWAELLKYSLFDYFYGIASKQKDSFTYHDGYSLGVRLTVSPYPNKEDVDRWKKVKAIDVPKEALRHVWLTDVMKHKDEVLLAGGYGVIGCVTARGTTVRECQRRVYRTIKNISLTDDIQYRNDIGDTVEKDKQQLTEWGWLNAIAG